MAAGNFYCISTIFEIGSLECGLLAGKLDADETTSDEL
jgi:hypothetical protein